MKYYDGSVGSIITLNKTLYLYILNIAAMMNGTCVFSSPLLLIDGVTTAPLPTHNVQNASSLRSHWHAKLMCYGSNQPDRQQGRESEEEKKITSAEARGHVSLNEWGICAFEEKVSRVQCMRLCAVVSSVGSWLIPKLVWQILNTP